MLEAVVIAVLYVLGAVSVMNCFVLLGYIQEARGEPAAMTAIGLMVMLWPLFVLCMTFTVIRNVLKLKRAARPQGEPKP